MRRKPGAALRDVEVMVRARSATGGATAKQVAMATGIDVKLVELALTTLLTNGKAERRKCDKLPHKSYRYVIKPREQPCCGTACKPVARSAYLQAKLDAQRTAQSDGPSSAEHS